MNTLRLSFVFWALNAMASFAGATTMIYPVEAIDDLWNLPADDFRQRYAGINISGLGPSDEGWYVRYKHENLTYLFGPLAEREEARKKKWDLETVRDAAIRNRPTLASSQVDFVKFTYSGVYGKGGNKPGGGSGGSRISADGKSGPDGDLDGDGIPNSKDDDMDGDGIPNAQDPDMDGDGIPNDKDDYAFGTNPDGDGKGGLAGDGSGGGKDGAGKGGAGKDGKGAGDGDKLAAGDGEGGDGGQAGGKSGKNGGKSGGQSGAGGEVGDGSDGGDGGQQGALGQKGRQIASNQRGGQSGSQGGQSGSQGGQSGQSGQQGGQQGGSSGGQAGASGGQPGGGGSPGGGSSSGGGGNPLSLLGALFKMILGL